MRYALIADIHANLNAFIAVLEDIKRRGGVADYLCLGDTIGSGPEPHQCIEVLRGLSPVCITGNHDLAAIGKLDISSFPPHVAAAIRWTMTQLTAGDIDYLGKLPATVVKEDLTLAHGSPRDTVREYLLSTTSATENFAHFQTQVCLVGHSHVPLIYELDGKGACLLHRPAADAVFLLSGNRYIINPGAVGLPMDGDPRASYAIYDSETRALTNHRVSYDIVATQARMRAASLPERLVTHLAGYSRTIQQ